MAYSRSPAEAGILGFGESDGVAGLFGIHIGVEIRQGGIAPFGIGTFPFGEEADGQTTEHAQDPYAVSVADATSVFVGGNVEALMKAVLNAPVLPGGHEPLCRIEAFRFPAGELKDGFRCTQAEMAVDPCNLRNVWKANPFGIRRFRKDLSTFPAALVLLVAIGLVGCGRLRGKNPPEGR